MILQKLNKLIILFLFIFASNIYVKAQNNTVDSIKIYSLEFNSLYYIKIDEVLLKMMVEPIVIIDTLLCNKLKKLLVEEYSTIMKGTTIKDYNPYLLNLRIFIEIYRGQNCKKIGISPQGKMYIDKMIFRYKKDYVIKTLTKTIPILANKLNASTTELH